MVAPAIIKAVPALQQDLIDNANYGYTNRSVGFMFGKRPATVQNALVDLWEGPTDQYVFPTTGLQLSVVSSSASDTSNGTGIRQIIIDYLDTSYVEHTEIVTLAGLTPVATVATNIFRINGVHAVAVGSGGLAAGNISITNGGVTYGYIAIGETLARQAVFTIPAGMNGYLSHWQCSSGASSGQHFTQVIIRATCHLGVLYPGVFLPIDEIGTLNSNSAVNFPTPIRMPATADVKMAAISDAVNANVTALGAATGWLES